MKRLNLMAAVLLALLLALAVPVAGAKRPPLPPQAQGPGLWLTVLHNNDAESKFLEQQFQVPGTTTTETHAGAARFKTLVDRLKAEATTGPLAAKYRGKRGVVMISSGDNFLAGPQFAASLDKGVPFYDSIAMNLIGYDAAAIGNHEFDFGPDVLADMIIGTQGFPWLSANLGFSAEPSLQALVDAGRIAKSTVVEERGERIGVVGATTPLLQAISSPRRVTVDPNVAGAVQAEIDKLEAAGVNKIILSSHLQNVQADLALIPMLRGVDVAIAGGGDELLANEGTPLIPGDTIQGAYPLVATNANGQQVPVVTTAGDFKYVGKLVVQFDGRGNVVGWDEEESGPVRVSGTGADAIPPDPAMQAQVVDPVAAFVADLAANVIGTSQVDLEGRRGVGPTEGNLAGTPGVRRSETNMGNLLADSLLWQATQLAPGFGVDEPDMSIQNGGGIRIERVLPAGPVTELNTFEIASFANFLSVVEGMTAAQVKQLLEHGVSGVPGVQGRFGHISGVTFTYDVTAAAQATDVLGNVTSPGFRVKHAELSDGTVLVMNGLPVAGPTVNVATHDFLARNGDAYPFEGRPFTTLGVTYQQGLANYIASPSGLNRTITAAQYPTNTATRIFCVDGNGAGTAPDCPSQISP